MKNFIALAFALVLIFSLLTACSNDTAEFLPNTSTMQMGNLQLESAAQEWQLLSSDVLESRQVILADGWVYYIGNEAPTGNGREYIYRIKNDGTGNEKLLDQTVYYFDLADGWIYYNSHFTDGHLSKMKIDGTQQQKISDELIPEFKVFGDWIHYQNDDGKSYRIHVSGTPVEALD